MSKFYTGIITIIPLIGFIINSICLIGGFFLGHILLLKSISFLSFWKFFNIHFILMNLNKFLFMYVLYIFNKDKKEYINKQNKGEEIKECNENLPAYNKKTILNQVLAGFLGAFSDPCNENLPVYNKKMILNHVLAGFLGALSDPFSVFFVILFFSYRCLLMSTLHSFFYKGVTSILFSIYFEKLGYNFEYILFTFLILIIYCVVYFVKKKPRGFLIIGMLVYFSLFFFLFIYKSHSHDLMLPHMI